MRKIRMGMVGGGDGAFIGAVHRAAAALDGQIELVCGAFSGDPERSRASGATLYLPPERVYGSYGEMLAREASLPDSEKMDFVAIVTPNHLHFPIARDALNNGFHVMSDKPATVSLKEALDLKDMVAEAGLLFGLTYTYSGYPLVKEARKRIMSGELGRVRKILVEYQQGWLSTRREEEGDKQAQWRVDPSRAGKSGCMGDIGSHAFQLAEYMSGHRVEAIAADLSVFVEGRELDDDGSMLLRFDEGAKGVLTASQVCAGEENALRIRIYGERGGLEWSQEEPNSLLLKWLDRPTEALRAGSSAMSGVSQRYCRLPGGHPEGYLEAMANIYRNFAECIRARLEKREPLAVSCDYPGIHDGVRGMAFIEAALESDRSAEKWQPLRMPNARERSLGRRT